jgi:phage repressor protein C with HTH and peptisase S24 domain
VTNKLTQIQKIFLAAISKFPEKWGQKTALAKLINRTPGYVSQIFKGLVGEDEETRRIFAEYYGYPGTLYDSFLDLGRESLGVQETKEDNIDPKDAVLDDEHNDNKYNLYIPFADKIRISGSQANPLFESSVDNPVHQIVIHALTINRTTAKGLQAFMINDNAMEPLIYNGGIIIVDTKENDPIAITEDKIYVICSDIRSGFCDVRYLSWGEKGKSFITSTHNRNYEKPRLLNLSHITLVGRVIWSCHNFN